MTQLEIQREETSSDFHEPNRFNIAGAFPATDGIVRKVAAERRRRRREAILDHPSFWVMVAALIVGFAGGAVGRRI